MTGVEEEEWLGGAGGEGLGGGGGGWDVLVKRCPRDGVERDLKCW